MNQVVERTYKKYRRFDTEELYISNLNDEVI